MFKFFQNFLQKAKSHPPLEKLTKAVDSDIPFSLVGLRQSSKLRLMLKNQ